MLLSSTSGSAGDSFSISRRDLLRWGGCLVGGLTLADLLRWQASAAGGRNENAVIFIRLGGGASQFETYDPKPQAAIETRGPFKAISTQTPGAQICELLPKHAAMMNQLAIVRSIHHEQASHIAEHIMETGYDLQNSANSLKGEMPSVGSVVSYVRGPNPSGLPGYVCLPRMHAYAGPHWLGAEHQQFFVRDDPNDPQFQVSNLALMKNLTADRLGNRRQLLGQLDSMKKARDLHGSAAALDAFSEQAFQMITGAKAQAAFDLEQESPQTRDRYGRTTLGQRMLLGRRLAEAGVPFISVRMGDWDDHENLVDKMQVRAPIYDQAITTLIQDLAERGLSQKVLVLATGEFGRTPRFNAKGGRDHWPAVNCALFAGGDFKMGQIIGSSDANGAHVHDAPYRPQNVLAMVYRHLGIDPSLTFNDYFGRPRYLLEERRQIAELV